MEAVDPHASTWAALRGHGLYVRKEDRHHLPPQFHALAQNQWRTVKPAVNKEKLPRSHDMHSTRGPDQRQVINPSRLGYGTYAEAVCAHNRSHNVECSLPCRDNANLQSRHPFWFLLAYDPHKQWCIHATRNYCSGEHVGEYVGEVLQWAEGTRRREAKQANDPSYLLELVPRKLFIDSEQQGNALRFVNHTCVNPSCKYEVVWVNGYPHIEVSANRDISWGEELTCAYGFVKHANSQCFCGHTWCSGFMGKQIKHPPQAPKTKIPRKPTVPE